MTVSHPGRSMVVPTVSLRAANRNVVSPLPSISGVRLAMRIVAAAVGEHDKGEAMVAGFERRVQQVASSPSARRPSAVVYQVGGTVSGPGSLAEAMLVSAGFRNKADEYRLTRGGQVPLELLVAEPPDLLVLSSNAHEYRTAVGGQSSHRASPPAQRHASLELPWQHLVVRHPRLADCHRAPARASRIARRPMSACAFIRKDIAPAVLIGVLAAAALAALLVPRRRARLVRLRTTRDAGSLVFGRSACRGVLGALAGQPWDCPVPLCRLLAPRSPSPSLVGVSGGRTRTVVAIHLGLSQPSLRPSDRGLIGAAVPCSRWWRSLARARTDYAHFAGFAVSAHRTALISLAVTCHKSFASVEMCSG